MLSSLLNSLFVVAIAMWVEVWKRFSHVSFCLVGGFWIQLSSVDPAPFVDETRCCLILYCAFYRFFLGKKKKILFICIVFISFKLE